MAPSFQDIVEEARLSARALMDYGDQFFNPTVRLGVTGLSRAGKTVFITALVQNLLRAGTAAREGERVLPVFRVHAEGRLMRAKLQPQPDDHVPRFADEDHLAALTGEDRHWPDSTRRISELRLTLEFERRKGMRQGPSELTLDIVDYPGEWLLDLPLLGQDFRRFSEATTELARTGIRAELARDWLDLCAAIDMDGPADEMVARQLATTFTAYLRACKADERSLSTLPPGRFLMPGDFAGSPLLAFAPLDIPPSTDLPRGSLGALMQRRYDSYVSTIVRPFFFGHFARLDRQIVLVDTLTALNAGAGAVKDLQQALTQILTCFRQGSNSILSAMFGRRIDRILFAATKADLLHHTSHDKLENILKLIVEEAMSRAEYAGAEIEVAAIAAIRATR